jgi:hypothetical protein
VQIAQLHDQHRLTIAGWLAELDALGESALIQQRTELAGIGRHGVFDAGVFAEGLALDPVGVEQRLAVLGQPHVERQELAVSVGDAFGGGCCWEARGPGPVGPLQGRRAGGGGGADAGVGAGVTGAAALAAAAAGGAQGGCCR